MDLSHLNRYIVVGPARSGTTVTHLSLAGHPNVSALSDEVRIKPFFTKGLSTFTHGNEKEDEREKGYPALFEAITALHRDNRTTALGFKTAVSSYRDAQIFCGSMRHHFSGTKVILTMRNDIVAQLGSLEHARITGKWHSWINQKRDVKAMITLEEDRLQTHAIDYLKTESELRSLNDTHDVFEVSYERHILTGETDVYYSLFDFLDLPPMDITWLNSEKVAPPPQMFISDYARHVEAVATLRERFESDPSSFSSSPSQLLPKRSGFLQKIRRGLLRCVPK